MLRRRKRVTCANCDASHPAIYEGQACLICGATLEAANGRRKVAGTVAAGRYAATEQQPPIAASQSEGDRVSTSSAALDRKDGVSTPDYERHVRIAAKGLAQRDSYSMPRTVATPGAFYEVMARAALDAIDLRALLERVARAERGLNSTQPETFMRSGVNSKHARHPRRTALLRSSQRRGLFRVTRTGK